MGKVLETQICSRNLSKGINTSTVSLIRYWGPFVKLTKEELKQMDKQIYDDAHGFTS